MMYEPDVWQVIKITSEKHGTVYKVLAGNYGGYLGADTWKLNSGITHCEYDDNFWYFHGYSGSVYKCHMNVERMSSLTHSIFNNLQDQLRAIGATVDIVWSYEGVKE